MLSLDHSEAVCQLNGTEGSQRSPPRKHRAELESKEGPQMLRGVRAFQWDLKCAEFHALYLVF